MKFVQHSETRKETEIGIAYLASSQALDTVASAPLLETIQLSDPENKINVKACCERTPKLSHVEQNSDV